jgi:hypothetical protein
MAMNYKYIMAISFAAVVAFSTLGVASVSAQVMNQYAYYASPVPTNYNQTFSAASSVYGYNAWQPGSACGSICAYALQNPYGYTGYQPQYYHGASAGFYQPAVWYQSTPGFYGANNGYTPTYQNNYTTNYNSYQTQPQPVYYSYGNNVRGFSTF